MRKFCEHCYTEYTAQPQCPYCEARPGLKAHIARGSEYLRQQKEKLAALRQDAAKGRSFGFLLWIIPAGLWMWLMSKAEISSDSEVSEEVLQLAKFIITYGIPIVIFGALMLLGFFLSGRAVKRRRKKLAAFDPILAEFFEVKEQNYVLYDQYRQQKLEKLKAKHPELCITTEDFFREIGVVTDDDQKFGKNSTEYEWEEDDDEDRASVGLFQRYREQWEIEEDEKYKREMEEIFMDDF